MSFAVAFACARLTTKICNNGMRCDRKRIELHESSKRDSSFKKEVKSTGSFFRILYLYAVTDTCEEIFDVDRFIFEFFYSRLKYQSESLLQSKIKSQILDSDVFRKVSCLE